jgi:uncharacterized protein (UPF0305 family)
MINKNFTIPLADEPYVDTTALNKTHAAAYTGNRYLKIVIDSETKYVERIVAAADTLNDINNAFVAQEPGKTYEILDANTHTFEAAYLTGMYDTGVTENYTETLPTKDAEGADETWSYTWEDNTGMILQQYAGRDLKFVNGAYVRPRFRTHALTRESFMQSMQQQISNINAALENNTTLTEETREQLAAYVTWLENLPTKYANIKHWKIPFKISVPIY